MGCVSLRLRVSIFGEKTPLITNEKYRAFEITVRVQCVEITVAVVKGPDMAVKFLLYWSAHTSVIPLSVVRKNRASGRGGLQ